MAAVDRQAGTLEQGAGRLSRDHSLARLPSRGCLLGMLPWQQGPLRTMSMMQKRPMAFSGWAALLSTDVGAGATSLREP